MIASGSFNTGSCESARSTGGDHIQSLPFTKGTKMRQKSHSGEYSHISNLPLFQFGYSIPSVQMKSPSVSTAMNERKVEASSISHVDDFVAQDSNEDKI